MSAGEEISNDSFSPKKIEWIDFEKEVVAYIEKELQRGTLGLMPKNTVVRYRPRYFSKHRNSEIEFDASIEWNPPGSETPGLIWLWECKKYTNRKVSVEEIEEFYDKLTQIDAHKGTVVTTNGFQDGAVEYAKSRRIMLVTLSKVENLVVQFSFDGGVTRVESIEMEFCLLSDGNLVKYGDSRYSLAGLIRLENGLLKPEQTK